MKNAIKKSKKGSDLHNYACRAMKKAAELMRN